MLENVQENLLNFSAGFIRHISLPIHQDTGLFNCFQRDIVWDSYMDDWNSGNCGIQTLFAETA